MEVFIAWFSLLSILISFYFIWKFEGLKIVLTPMLYALITEVRTIVPTFYYFYFIGEFPNFKIIIALCASIFPFLLGFYIFSLMLGYNGKKLILYVNKPLEISDRSFVKLKITFWFVLIFIIVVGFAYYGGIPPIGQSIKAMLIEGAAATLPEEMASIRIEITKGHLYGGEYKGHGVFRTIFSYGWMIILGLNFIFIKISNLKIRWRFIFIINLVLSFVFIAGDGARSPYLEALIFLVILASFLNPIKLKHVFVLIFGLFFLGITISLASNKMNAMLKEDKFLSLAVTRMFERIVLDNPVNDVRAIDMVYKGKLDYRNGAIHKRDFIAAFPGKGGGIPFANEFARILSGTETTAFLTGTYITKTFVDFGILGTALIFFALGGLFTFFQLFLLSFSKKPITLIFICILFKDIGSLVMSVIFSLIAGVVILAILYLIIFVLRYIDFRPLFRQTIALKSDNNSPKC